MTRYFIFATALGRTGSVGSIPAVASIGHLELLDNGKVGGAYWETHNWADHRPLIATGLSGPLGAVLRPCPSRLVYAPAYTMIWTPVGNGFDLHIGAITYSYRNPNDPADPDRLEVQNFYPGQWSTGFGYYTDALVGPPVTFDQTSQDPNSLGYAYYGSQFVSSAGVWNPSPVPAGVSTYLFNGSGPVLTYGLVEAGDGSGLKVGEMVGLNWLHHSNLWGCTYGGHAQPTLQAFGGHGCVFVLARRAGKLDRMLYLENSFQTAADPGNIVTIARLSGLFLPPGYND